jgi:hypothetical protein
VLQDVKKVKRSHTEKKANFDQYINIQSDNFRFYPHFAMYFCVTVDTRGYSPPVILDLCFLCGFLMNEHTERRNKQLSSLASNLLLKCGSTVFVYKHILTLFNEAMKEHKPNNGKFCKRVPLCIACENWRRRLLSQVQNRHSVMRMIPMDAFIMFMHEPGNFKVISVIRLRHLHLVQKSLTYGWSHRNRTRGLSVASSNACV